MVLVRVANGNPPRREPACTHEEWAAMLRGMRTVIGVTYRPPTTASALNARPPAAAFTMVKCEARQ